MTQSENRPDAETISANCRSDSHQEIRLLFHKLETFYFMNVGILWTDMWKWTKWVFLNCKMTVGQWERNVIGGGPTDCCHWPLALLKIGFIHIQNFHQRSSTLSGLFCFPNRIWKFWFQFGSVLRLFSHQNKCCHCTFLPNIEKLHVNVSEPKILFISASCQLAEMIGYF